MTRIGLGIGAVAALAVLGTVGCARSRDPQAPVLILAAASTRDAVQEIAADFTQQTGVGVQVSPEDSGKLATQIAHGAPADLFLSANEKWADYVRDQGLALEMKPLLGNNLVLIVPQGNRARVHAPEDLTGTAVKRVALAGPTVPAGIYARQALTNLKLLPELEKENKIATGENVRVTLTYVERGEAEAGIVYGSDARLTDRVEVVYRFAAATHEPIVYPLVLLKAAEKSGAARRFYDYLQGPAAAGVFEKYGFTQPELRTTSVVDNVPATSRDWFLTPGEWSAVWLSLLVSVTATTVSLPFGVALGRLLARRQFAGKSVVETALSLPLVLPPVVTGYLLLVAFGRQGWLGRQLEDWFGVSLVFTWEGAALASAVMAFPLMVRAIRLAFAEVDMRLEQASRTLGVGPVRTFFRVSLPLARRGVIAGTVLAFARSMGEFGATVMIAGNIPGETQTIPLYIYSQLNVPGGVEGSARLVVVSVLIAAAALIMSEFLERRGQARRTTV
jgi:molybdate transport system permease protein